MKLLYLEEHLACSNYVSDYNVGFKYYHISKGEYFVSSNLNCNCLLFLIKGNIKLSYESQDYILKRNNIGFFPVSTEYTIQVIADADIVINYFNKPIDLCEKLALESLFSFVGKKSHTPIVKTKPALRTFLSSLIYFLREGASCKHFHEIKQKELFFILRFFYTKEEVAGLFAPIISRNLDFKSIVLNNYLNTNSVKELAKICNYSLSSFNRNFKNNFNENPYIWLQNQKLKYIIGKLSNKNIPFSQIIDEFRFSSPAHFTIYCKKHLHLTPSQFRKKHTK
ncbi:MAG: AraC family transcriptional regulator [Dysgonamonadaceae bacterium]|jgi:AraC-like DNA-binding protein|nr:AraC family transcriptional regulator [Dysgonamonadaceae bacterium]